MDQPPKQIENIGTEIAFLWPAGRESYLPHEFLREKSPSAENQGEVDILGQRHGGDGPRVFPGVKIVDWEKVGNYAICFHFSDGHSTGIYSWGYLRKIDSERQAGSQQQQ